MTDLRESLVGAREQLGESVQRQTWNLGDSDERSGRLLAGVIGQLHGYVGASSAGLNYL